MARITFQELNWSHTLVAQMTIRQEPRVPPEATSQTCLLSLCQRHGKDLGLVTKLLGQLGPLIVGSENWSTHSLLSLRTGLLHKHIFLVFHRQQGNKHREAKVTTPKSQNEKAVNQGPRLSREPPTGDVGVHCFGLSNTFGNRVIRESGTEWGNVPSPATALLGDTAAWPWGPRRLTLECRHPTTA